MTAFTVVPARSVFAAWSGPVVGVSATVLWSDPSSPRSVDAPAIADVPDLDAWADGLSDEDRLGLIGRADTHALLGEPVEVLATAGPDDEWSRVLLPAQPSSKDAGGYPGWVRSAHLSSAATIAPDTEFVVVRSSRSVVALTSDGGRLTLSLGTILPLAAAPASRPAPASTIQDPAGIRAVRSAEPAQRPAEPTPGLPSARPSAPETVALTLPGGRTAVVAAAAVALLPAPAAPSPAAPAAPAAPAEVPVDPAGALAIAREFARSPYLWAGLSSAGVDCSGLVHLAYRSLGFVVPRDADDQSLAGRQCPLTEVREGDPVFFVNDSGVHHVALATGDGAGTFHAPRTGRPVAEGSWEDPGYAGETVITTRLV